jgi:hypothetical protein
LNYLYRTQKIDIEILQEIFDGKTLKWFQYYRLKRYLRSF